MSFYLCFILLHSLILLLSKQHPLLVVPENLPHFLKVEISPPARYHHVDIIDVIVVIGNVYIVVVVIIIVVIIVVVIVVLEGAKK